MCYELENKGYKVQREVVKDILYDYHILGYGKADITVNNEYVFEMKSLEKIKDKEINQVERYSDLFNMKTGYIININHKNYEIVSVGAKAKPYVRVEQSNTTQRGVEGKKRFL